MKTLITVTLTLLLCTQALAVERPYRISATPAGPMYSMDICVGIKDLYQEQLPALLVEGLGEEALLELELECVPVYKGLFKKTLEYIMLQSTVLAKGTLDVVEPVRVAINQVKLGGYTSEKNILVTTKYLSVTLVEPEAE